jgi:hypothetical protein
MTNTDDTASGWRDLADQLRPDEIMRLDEQERSGETEAWLLGPARALARENLADVMFGHVVDPPDAETLFGWQTGDDGVSFREFKGEASCIGGMALLTTGRQYSDGHCGRRITLTTFDGEELMPDGETLTPDEARELAAALQEAADREELG